MGYMSYDLESIMAGVSLYNRWLSMKARCHTKSHKNYKNYGGRGIYVHVSWRCSFKTFANWAIRHGYRPSLELDRRDNDKGYYPTNCRWSTRQVQVCNTRRTPNSTGYTGVRFRNANAINKYEAYIKVMNRQYHVGAYTTARRAAIARDIFIVRNRLPHNIQVYDRGIYDT